MTQETKITFDEFGWSALEERAAEEQMGLEDLLALALTYYESELDSGRVAIDVPRFRRSPAGGETRALKISIEPDSRRRLGEEAERRGVSFERLCEHASIVLLADLDSGKAAERIIERARSASSSRPPSGPA